MVATHTVNPDSAKGGLKEATKEHHREFDGFDVVIEAVGVPATLVRHSSCHSCRVMHDYTDVIFEGRMPRFGWQRWCHRKCWGPWSEGRSAT